MKKLDHVLDRNVIQEHLDSGYRLTVCPVCGNETFDDYFVCPHCGWENDGTKDVDEFSSANNSTIKNYRNNL